MRDRAAHPCQRPAPQGLHLTLTRTRTLTLTLTRTRTLALTRTRTLALTLTPTVTPTPALILTLTPALILTLLKAKTGLDVVTPLVVPLTVLWGLAYALPFYIPPGAFAMTAGGKTASARTLTRAGIRALSLTLTLTLTQTHLG